MVSTESKFLLEYNSLTNSLYICLTGVKRWISSWQQIIKIVRNLLFTKIKMTSIQIRKHGVADNYSPLLGLSERILYLVDILVDIWWAGRDGESGTCEAFLLMPQWGDSEATFSREWNSSRSRIVIAVLLEPSRSARKVLAEGQPTPRAAYTTPARPTYACRTDSELLLKPSFRYFTVRA